jgi:hypothetical protein
MAAEVKITADIDRAPILLDGQDVSADIAAYAVEQRGGHPSVVTFRLTPKALPEWEGRATVQVLPPDQAPGVTIAQFCKAIDPTILEELALEAVGVVTDNLTRAMLLVLAELAEGRSGRFGPDGRPA